MARGPVVGAALASFTLGLIIGVFLAWEIWPVQFANADPGDLRPVYKDDYVRMISAAYKVDGNLVKARQRLSQLHLVNVTSSINGLVAREKQTGRNSSALTALANLAQVLSTPQVAQRPTYSPTLERTLVLALPTLTVPVFRLAERTPLTCLEAPETAILRVFVRDVRGGDLPNVPVEIRWPGGDETIYTGLKPERGIGYADFQAVAANYAVTILNAQSDTASDLLVVEAPGTCKPDRVSPRGWKLTFQQK
jgi:hypothetical protein